VSDTELRVVVGHPFERYCPLCGERAGYIGGVLQPHTVAVIRKNRPRTYRTCVGPDTGTTRV